MSIIIIALMLSAQHVSSTRFWNHPLMQIMWTICYLLLVVLVMLGKKLKALSYQSWFPFLVDLLSSHSKSLILVSHIVSIYFSWIMVQFILFSALQNMQSIRNSILWHVRGRRSAETWLFCANGNKLNWLSSQTCPSTAKNADCVMDRVIGLVKRFNSIDASKVIG